jgi:hypothetical protein
MATTPFIDPGDIKEPEVSVPTLSIVKYALVAMAEPLLEPETGKFRP